VLQAFEFIAALCAALFAGAALYITLAEHPARMGLETRIAALQWAPSYKRATWMQVPLALLSVLSGVVAWRMGDGLGWLVAALLIGAVVPFTLIGITPTNHQLLAPGRDLGSADTRTLLERWGTINVCRGSSTARRWGVYPLRQRQGECQTTGHAKDASRRVAA
jgi:hypothetical protein